jgi:two-component system, sensor histidine kinase and response regulator
MSMSRKDVRILVADDQAVNRKLTMRQLERLGFTVDVAANGIEAVDAISRTEYDLVFLDCQMPAMNGFEAAEEIRRRGKRAPIVALTASVLGEDRDRCLQAGMDDYLTKPVREADLMRVLSRWIVDLRPPIDNATTSVLQQLGDSGDVLKEVIGIYFTEAPPHIDGIRNAIAAGDAKMLRAEAHALRSSSGNVGATRVVEICAELEAIGRNGSVSKAADLLLDLENEYRRAEVVLREMQQT